MPQPITRPYHLSPSDEKTPAEDKGILVGVHAYDLISIENTYLKGA
jgi:hypothetical protein